MPHGDIVNFRDAPDPAQPQASGLVDGLPQQLLAQAAAAEILVNQDGYFAGIANGAEHGMSDYPAPGNRDEVPVGAQTLKPPLRQLPWRQTQRSTFRPEAPVHRHKRVAVPWSQATHLIGDSSLNLAFSLKGDTHRNPLNSFSSVAT